MFNDVGPLSEIPYSVGEGPATRVSLSLPEGSAEAIRLRVGKREFSAFITGAVARRKLSHEGTLVLDCERLPKFVSDHECVVAPIAEARKRGMEMVINALTITEAVHRRTDKARLAWVLSGVRIVHIDDMAKRRGDRVRLVAA